MNLLIVTGLTLGSLAAHAEAGYADQISARTQKYTGMSGQWYSLSTSDWIFFEGEASAQYNLGAIAAGTKVEVLKMNKQMARVRLPDGRVVFVRNRLLQSTTAPDAVEKRSQAAKTAAIGREKLHGGNPHARPKTTDYATPEVAAVPDARPVIADKQPEKEAEKPSVELPTRGVALPSGSVATDTGAIPLPNPDRTKDDAVVVAPSGAVVPPVADGTPANVPIPTPRPTDIAAQETPQDAAQASGTCDPNKQWQSPVHQKFRITDCLGSARDGGGRRHAGIDIAGEKPGMQGIPIFPTASGRVIRSGHNGGYGCFVEIKHDTCPDSIVKWRRQSGCITRYAHMAMKTVKTRKGKSVRVCDVIADGTKVTPCTRIGKMSGTGKRGRANDYASHLHFELRDDSTSVAYNPNTLIAGLRRSPAFMSAGSASCKGSNALDAADVGRLNSGRIVPIANVRETEGRN